MDRSGVPRRGAPSASPPPPPVETPRGGDGGRKTGSELDALGTRRVALSPRRYARPRRVGFASGPRVGDAAFGSDGSMPPFSMPPYGDAAVAVSSAEPRRLSAGAASGAPEARRRGRRGALSAFFLGFFPGVFSPGPGGSAPPRLRLSTDAGDCRNWVKVASIWCVKSTEKSP